MIMRIRTNTLVGLSFIFTVSNSQVVKAAGLDATLDRSRVVDGDSVILSLVASGDNQGSPDLSGLAQDFEVLGQSQSTRMTILNGAAKTSSEWQITILPKRTGTLTLPSINLGNLSSDPLQLQVLPADQAGKISQDRPVLLEVATDTKTPYVQAQVVYTLRILSRVPMRQAQLTEPKTDNAILERLGNDINYKTNRNSQSYQVTERRYAIFPQRSGLVTIDAPMLSAAIPEPGGRRLLLQDPFFGMPFGDPLGDLGTPLTHQTQVRGHDVVLEVKPQPPNTASIWLPAKKLELSETWSINPLTFKVGEPVTRTITIKAQGLSAAQIPDLTPPLPDGIKSYPDKAQSTNQIKDSDIVATKILKQALVPTQAGTFILPEMRLNWWNTETNHPQEVSLAERTIEVLPITATTPQNEPANAVQSRNDATNSKPAPGNAASTPDQKSNLPSTPSPVNAVPQADDENFLPRQRRKDFADVGENRYWIWLAASLGLIWVITLSLWLRERWRNQGHKRQIKVTTVNLNRAKAGVKHSCLANNPRSAKTALLNWASAKWPAEPPQGLDNLAKLLNAEAATIVLQEIDRQLYATANASPEVWDGASAWRVLAPLLQDTNSKPSKAQALPDLYPVT